ncbi:hypothetical protein L6R52_35900, partial [Myxococcota bacterium]|nr:hypothetical protein [Myxococcota bacterium]
EGVRIEIHRPEPIREHLREQARAEPVRVDPPRGDRADRDAPKISIETGSNTTNVMIAIVVLLVVAGAGLGYLVLARTREPLVVPVRLPAEQPRAIARAPGPNEAALTALTGELEVAADAAGYGLDELGEAGPAAALANDWQSAREAGDLDAAKSAHAKLVEVLKSLRPDAAHLRKKCSALSVEIEALRGHLPDAKHQQLGDRARDLSTRAASATKPAELRELARTARALRRELGEALRAR